MLWFRIGCCVGVALTMIFALSLLSAIIAMLTATQQRKVMSEDPNYNGTLIAYIIIIMIQIWLIFDSICGMIIEFKVWRNNYQLDHKLRHWFIMWLCNWGLGCLLDLGVAIWCLVRLKEPQEEMAYLYEIFAKYSQDVQFISGFEKYQREASCCGIYGPDDWLMVQLRTQMGAGGGGGGYQSMDYGFRQNPSTGKCHLTPPTVPSGCGKRLLEEVHVKLYTYAALMILEAAIAVASGILAWYCFFYWLEKEVIVIPEDEVSNLIIIEPESSTTTVEDNPYLVMSNGGGYLVPEVGYSHITRIPTQGLGSQPYYGGSQRPIRSVSQYANDKRNPNKQSKKSNTIPPVISSGPKSHAVTTVAVTGMLGSVPPGSSKPMGPKSKVPSGAVQHQENNVATASFRSARIVQQSYTRPPNQSMLSAAGPYDANSRFIHRSVMGHGQLSYLPNPPGSRFHPPAPHKKHSVQHMLHKQEAALGGKLLGEMHVDHNKDPDPMNPKASETKGKHGHQTHHATVAIVRNKHPPPPKQLITVHPVSGHHGQTGHLAEDILEMSGKSAQKYVDDIVLPVEHNPMREKGGYLGQQKHLRAGSRTDEVEQGMAHLINNGTAISAPSVDGSQAQFILDDIIAPVAVAHVNNRNLEQEVTPLIQAHYAGNQIHGQHGGTHYLGQHNQAHYLQVHGPNEHGHYLPGIGSNEVGHLPEIGSHEQGYYHHLPGEHEQGHYLPRNHENTHYLPGNQGYHENAHYLQQEGHHEHAHYLSRPEGRHENANYLPQHEGHHENGHYLPQHEGHHDNAHYLPEHRNGHHENANYLPEHEGHHENTHYLPDHHNHAPENERRQHQNEQYVSQTITRRVRTEAHILYKNPAALDDTD